MLNWIKQVGWDTYSAKLDVPMYSMGMDIIPLIMGRKEYTPTLFPASVMEAGLVKNSDSVHTNHPASFLWAGKSVGVHSFLPDIYSIVNSGLSHLWKSGYT